MEPEPIRFYYIHEDGSKTLQEEYFLLNGKLHGTNKLYDRKGKLIETKTYSNGKLNGECISYNILYGTELKPIKKYIQYFENGVELSTKLEL